ncbi:MAG: prolyl oligopeptidase family serine peptidase [Bacteroidales bacterium]
MKLLSKLIITGTIILCGALFSIITAQDDGFKTPPKELTDIVLAQPTPTILFSPNKKAYAILTINDLPNIKEQSREDVRLAGQRVLISTNSPLVKSKIKKIEIKRMPGEIGFQGIVTGFRDDVNIIASKWSPNGQYLATAVEESNGIYLWVIDISTGKANQLSGRKLNFFFGSKNFNWSPSSNSIFTSLIPQSRAVAPKENGKEFPVVPTILQSWGKKGGVRTFQDLLKSKYDEYLFDYYATSSLTEISLTGNVKQIGKDAIYINTDYSPNGEYLMVQYVYPPFSYQVGYRQFPNSLELWDKTGKLIKVLNKKQLIVGDSNPSKDDANSKDKKRGFAWRPDKSASLYWFETNKIKADTTFKEGNTKNKNYDRLVEWNAPFTDTITKTIFQPEFKIKEILWGNTKNLFVKTLTTPTKEEKKAGAKAMDELYYVANFDELNYPNDSLLTLKASLKLISSTLPRNLYAQNSNLITTQNEFGNNVVYSPNNYATVYFNNKGNSPKGAYPFINKYNLKNGLFTTIWNCTDPYYETPTEFCDLKKGTFITTRESETEYPNHYLVEDFGKKHTQLTNFTTPTPSVAKIKKQVIEYYRKDSVLLRGTLYTPISYNGKDKLPLFIWAYPSEYKDKTLAEQRSDSPNKYIKISRNSILMMVQMGYAVLNDASFPIIGSDTLEPNNNYIKDLVNNAEAAIKAVANMGIADTARVACGGHSYGAFMTANLLAHSNLFAGGIARSGAYNRTLTPFGFQSEERNFWEAQNVYLEMSPFVYAHKIKTPILMIHGLDDNNSGTFTVQSERLYSAIQGNGGKVRLVLLPYESHGYVTMESLLHLAWESYNFLENNVKNKK